MRVVILAAVVVFARVASAAPAADLVVYWAPLGTPAGFADQAAAAARTAGAAFVDQSPAPTPIEDVAALVRRGRGAYDALQFEDAVAVLDAAAAAATVAGGHGLTRAELGELFLYRGLAWIQRGGDERGWDDLITAARVDPTRVLDPGRFPPRAIDAYARALAALQGAPRARLVVTGAEACTVTIDGALATGGSLEVGLGPHWVHAACRNRPAWGQRLEVGAAGATVAVPALVAPTDDGALIQARASGAAAVVVVAVIGAVVTLRRLAIDGRELDRRTVAAIAPRGPADAGAALAALLAAPRAPAPRWYRSRWVWAAAGATAVAAVLVPWLVIDRDQTRAIVVRPTGLPPW